MHKKNLSSYRDYLYSTISSQKYKTINVEDQIGALKFMVEKIKQDCKNGVSIKDSKINVAKYISNFLVETSKPTIGDFYIPRTMEYLYTNKDILKEAIERFVREKKNSKTILDESRSRDISENLRENIDIAISIILLSIEDMKLIQSTDILEIQRKIRNEELKPEDSEKLYTYVYKLMKEKVEKCRAEAYERAEKNPEKVYKTLIDNMMNIFDIQKPQQADDKKLEEIIKSEKADKRYSLTTVSMEEKKAKVKNFLSDPFYGDSLQNDYLVVLSEILGALEEDELMKMYEIIEKSKTDKRYKEAVIKYFKKITSINKVLDLKTALSKRIARTVELLSDIGCMEQFNRLNNKRLSNLGLSEMSLETSELIRLLSNVKQNASCSLEAEIGIATFYTNRAAKIVPAYLRALFILDKNGAFEKIYENPQLEYEDLNISQRIVEQNMSEYDGLKKVMLTRCVDGKDENGCDKLDYDELEIFRKLYEEKYKNFIPDLQNILLTYNFEKYFYLQKNFSISSLIYTILTDSKVHTLNWGYVRGDENKDKRKILLGFDIESLNMTIFFHCDIEEIKNIIEKITGGTVIPVFEGAEDYKYIPYENGRMTTAIAYPATKKQRKCWRNRENKAVRINLCINHLEWLQRPKCKTHFSGKIGSKLYDISTGKIIQVPDASDSGDEPEL